MSPSVCITDAPILVADGPCRRNKYRTDRNKIAKHPRLELRCVPNLSASAHLTRTDSLACSSWKTDSHAKSMSLKANISGSSPNEPWEFVTKRRRGLLDIAIRTIALMHRNRVLQKNLDALRFETTHFLESVFNTPGNDDKIVKSSTKMSQVTSSTANEHEEQDISAQSFSNNIRTMTSTPHDFSDADSSISTEHFSSDQSDF